MTYAIRKSTLSEFKKFVKERERIRLKKAAGAPAPWTKDPVLAKYHFTNIDRDHDTGTRWAHSLMDGAAEYGTNADVLFNVMCYRIINNIDTARATLPVWARTFNASKYEKQLRTIRESGHKVFSKAHQNNTFMLKPHEYGATKIDALKLYAEIARRQSKWVMRGGWERFRKATNINEAVDLLVNETHMGRFTATQATLDMLYCPAGVNARDWVTFTRHDAVKVYNPVQAGSGLALMSMFGCRGPEVNAKLLEVASMMRLAPIVVEHALCEFSKYVRLQNGDGRKRLYVPNKNR